MTAASRGPRFRQGGMTLIETVVALALVGVVVLPLLAVLPAAVTATRRLIERTEACQVALAELELLKNQPYDDIATGESHVSNALGSIYDTVDTVEEAEVAPGATALKLTVAVYRHPYDPGQNPLFSVSTLLAEGGV